MNQCPQCNSPIPNETDMVCLQCGTPIHSSKNTPKKIQISREIPVQEKKHVKQTPVFKNSLFVRFLSFAFLVFTLLFTYLYLFNFSGFFYITDYLLSQNKIKPAALLYEIFEKIALSRDQNDINFRRIQLYCEQMNSLEPNSLPYVIKCYRHYHQNNQTHMKLAFINNSPSPVYLENRYFYIKTEEGIFFPVKPSEKENLGPVSVPAWHAALGGMSVKGVSAPLDAKIVFNNGKNYAIFPFKINKSSNETEMEKDWSVKVRKTSFANA